MRLPNLVKRDTDAVLRARMLLAVAWALFGGAGIGIALGYFFVAKGIVTGPVGVLLTLLFTALITGAVSGLTLLASESAGRAANSWLHPGAGVKVRSDHSFPRSLVARGQPEEAVRAFEVAVATDPADPDPYLEIARIHRDHLGRPEEALRWFRRAREQSRLSPGESRVLIREIVELARKRLGDPARAAPDLARHAELSEGTPEGEWAKGELAELKRAMRERTRP